MFKALLEQFSTVAIHNTHVQHVQKWVNDVRTSNQQVELFYHLLGPFRSINLTYEEWYGLFSDYAGVTFAEIGEILSEVWCTPGVNPDAFFLSRIVPIEDENETVETRPF